MFFRIDAAERRKAKSPHELAMVNLLLFNLLTGVALLAGSMAQPDSLIATYKWLAIAVPLGVSLAIIAFTWRRAARAGGSAPWFVAAHWKLAASRYRVLLIAYVITGAILSLSFFGDRHDPDKLAEQIQGGSPAMMEMQRRKLESQDMGSAVWARIAVVPLLLTVMVTIMLESGSLYQAGRGEVPDGFTKRFPPPADLARSDSEVLLEEGSR